MRTSICRSNSFSPTIIATMIKIVRASFSSRSCSRRSVISTGGPDPPTRFPNLYLHYKHPYFWTCRCSSPRWQPSQSKNIRLETQRKQKAEKWEDGKGEGRVSAVLQSYMLILRCFWTMHGNILGFLLFLLLSVCTTDIPKARTRHISTVIEPSFVNSAI